MRKATETIIDAWMVGRAKHSAKSKQTGDYVLSTDGIVLFSYKLAIARKLKNGDVELVERERAPSATTRSHIDAVRRQFYGCTVHEDCRADRALAKACSGTKKVHFVQAVKVST